MYRINCLQNTYSLIIGLSGKDICHFKIDYIETQTGIALERTLKVKVVQFQMDPLYVEHKFHNWSIKAVGI